MIQAIITSIQTSNELKKCRHCGCMRETLEEIKNKLSDTDSPEFYPLFVAAGDAFSRLEGVEYS